MRSVWLVLSVMVLGCGGSVTTAPPPGPYELAAGAYQLTAVNGNLPDTVVVGADSKSLYGGALTLVGDKNDHRYLLRLDFAQLPLSATPNYSATFENGTYELVGSSIISFHVDNGTTHSGTIATGAILNRHVSTALGNLALNFRVMPLIL
jgi:hypothetical protein